jgi:AcrR family transcriptional regulator
MSVKRVGRPRQESLDGAILDATASIVESRGYGALSIEAVAVAAGTTRATVYRRHPSVAELVISTLADRFGTDPGVDTGTLEGDLLAIQRHRLVLFSHPLIVRGLPGLIDALSRQPVVAESFSRDFLAPRRRATTRAVERAVARGELSGDPDAEWISDLLTGPLLMRALLPGLQPIDEPLIERTVRSALRALAANGGVPPAGGG